MEIKNLIRVRTLITTNWLAWFDLGIRFYEFLEISYQPERLMSQK